MKKIITFLLFAFLMTSCQNEKKQFQINGKISNYSKNYALFVHDTIGIGISTLLDTIKIDSNGNFNIETKLLKSNSLLIFDDEKTVRLTIPNSVNSSIKVDLDFLESDSIKIDGEQASFVKFQFDQQKYWAKIYKEMSNKHPVIAKRNIQNIEYHKIQDTITQLRIKYLQQYFENSNIPNQEYLIDNERNSLIYSNLYYRMSGQKNSIVKQLEFYEKSNKSSTKILTYSDEVDFSNKSLFSIHFYRQFINDAIMNTVRIENPNGNFSSYEFYLNEGLNVIDKWYKKPELSKLQKIVFINHLVSSAKIFKSPVKISEFQNKIESLREDNYANENLSIIENKLKELDNLILKFSKGTKSPNFKLKNLEGGIYELSDFKNKTIFIDVWASWCGPCIASFPKWNKLVENYSNNTNFKFLSVSIDKDKDKWIKATEKLDLKGLKLYAGKKGFDSPFAKDFEINSIPNYISIDSKGNIISISSSVNDFQEIIKNKLSKK